MTLSRWMKDYLYIPLGGNRIGTGRTYFNLWTVFLLSGLWHGASWNFVIWGGYHGLFLVLERLFLGNIYQRIGRIPSTVITFLIAMFGWVLFRTETFTDALHFYQALLSFGQDFELPGLSSEFKWTMGAALIFSFMAIVPAMEKWSNNMVQNSKVGIFTNAFKTLVSILLFVFCLSMITASGFNPFIYFKF